MCYRCEVLPDSGLFKKRLTLGRGCLCFLGGCLVICLGFAMGLMAFYLPSLDILSDDSSSLSERDRIYSNLQDDLMDDRLFLLSNDSSCNNYGQIKAKYEGSYVYQCNSTMCVPADLRCGGYYDCDDDSDEDSCEEFCNLAVPTDVRFTCNNPKTTANDASYGPEYPPCFLYAYKCDGGVDCPDDDPNEDQVCPEESFYFERGNGTFVCSMDNNFLCNDKEYCVTSANLCDGISDCLDNSDERGC